MIRAVATKSERASGTSTNPVTSKGSSSIQTARRTWVEYRDQTGLALGNLGTFILMISCDAGRRTRKAHSLTERWAWFFYFYSGYSGLRRRARLTWLYDLLGLIEQLHDRHRRGVAGAETDLEDPQIAARAALEAGPQILEQDTDGFVVAQAVEREPAVAHAVFLRERDQGLDDAAQLLGLRQRGAHRLVHEQRRREVAVHRPAVRGLAAEPTARISVTHRTKLRSDQNAIDEVGGVDGSSLRSPGGGQLSSRMPSAKPCCSSTSLISVSDFLPRFGVRNSSTSVRCTRSPM